MLLNLLTIPSVGLAALWIGDKIFLAQLRLVLARACWLVLYWEVVVFIEAETMRAIDTNAFWQGCFPPIRAALET